MEAIAFSALIAAYLLIPNAIFRFLLGWFVPLRVFQGSRTEEITRAVATLIFLFVAALLLVWFVPVCKSHPFFLPDNSQQRTSDYTIVVSGLHSEPMFKEYGQGFWDALWRVLARQGRVIFWYYVLVAIIAVGLGLLTRYYGTLKRNSLFSWFADIYLLPHISQWHPILTGFTFPGKPMVKADVLMSNDVLYDGEVADYFLNADGTLAGLFLKNPRRFERDRYLSEREEWGHTRAREKFWRNIPSAKLYLIGARIVNLNLRYEPQEARSEILQEYIASFLKAAYQPTVTIRSRS